MDPFQNNSAESSNNQEGQDEARQHATRSTDNAANANPAQDQPSTGHRHTFSDSPPVLPPYWAPQPVYPPSAPFPTNPLDRGNFPRRDQPSFSPHMNQPGSTSQSTRDPNHGFSAPHTGVGAAVAVGGGMSNVGAGPEQNRVIPKRRYTKRKPKYGPEGSVTNKPPVAKKPQQPSSGNINQSSTMSASPGATSNVDDTVYDQMTRNINAAITNMSSVIADVASLAHREIANAAAARAAGADREDSGDEDEEEPTRPSSS